jgi:hypothetical protein
MDAPQVRAMRSRVRVGSRHTSWRIVDTEIVNLYFSLSRAEIFGTQPNCACATKCQAGAAWDRPGARQRNKSDEDRVSERASPASSRIVSSVGLSKVKGLANVASFSIWIPLSGLRGSFHTYCKSAQLICIVPRLHGTAVHKIAASTLVAGHASASFLTI